MNDTYKQALEVCQRIIGLKPTITDEEANFAMVNILAMPMFSSLDKDLLKKEILSQYSVPIDAYRILEGKEKSEPWLKDFKANQKSKWEFWLRYKYYLETQQGFAPNVIIQLDNLTDRILDNLFNPQVKNIGISKKGLVVGQVQSGKTANYIGLTCKAADAGFNFIVVLAGIHNNLRSQTQSRLDEGFLGFDTQFERVYANNQKNKKGVGLIPGYSNTIANSITTSYNNGDFTKKAAQSLGINFNTPQPFLLVIKKNASVLKRLYTWLHTQSTNGLITNKSLLLIDDEADNASINTNKVELDPSRINGYIRDIISLFNKSAYVGYTATPFANIFIPEGEDDLFPEDFIINLPAPSSYIGPDKVFGISVNPDDASDETLPIVTAVTDYALFVPEHHKKDDHKPELSDLPESLKTAVKCFIMTCAIRMARGQGNKHNSMLIHVSRFQVWQNSIKELVEKLFNYYKQEIEASDAAIMEEFRQILEVDTKDYKSYKTVTSEILDSKYANIDKTLTIHSWDEIRPLLYKVVQKIEVKSINGTSGDCLSYDDNARTGISVIAIGGDKLSRGLTLEGLSVSYFLRASKMYDTLMQMGRWFGYRNGYVDLCRLYTSPELNEWFRHITIASEELRDEFNYLAESGSTPRTYGLKVRSHPDCLQITSLSKMRYTRDIRVSWAGRLVETYQLSTNKNVIHCNLAATKDFLVALGQYEMQNGNYLWRNISADNICEFLSKFRVAESLKKVDLDMICKYISELVQSNESTSWSVALMSKSSSKVNYRFSDTINAGCFDRNRANDTDENSYYIRKNHIVGNQQDEFIDLDVSLQNNAKARTIQCKKEHGIDWTKSYPAPEVVRQEYRSCQNPLLIIYPLNPVGANILDENKHIKEGTVSFSTTDEPFIGFAISFPHTETECAVSYTVNQISEYASTESEFEQNNDNEYEE